MSLQKVDTYYYDVLEITREATEEEIKTAFRRLAHRYHPDRETGNKERFIEVQTAYNVLKNPARRKDYDRHGVRQKTSAEPDANARARSYILQIIMSIVDQDSDDSLRYNDIMRKVAGQYKNDFAKNKAAISHLQKVLHRYEEVGERFESDDVFIEIAFMTRMAQIREQLATGEKENEQFKVVGKMLKKIKYNHETRQRSPSDLRSPFYSKWTSTSSSSGY